jgi:ABC-2 type transport system permease protein/oleandomycin transport system permease protein
VSGYQATVGSRLRLGAFDALTLTRRNLLIWFKVPAFIVFTVIQPVMFTLLFRYVFGGAIFTGLSGGYVNFLLPGVIGQTAAFTSFGTAISLASGS